MPELPEVETIKRSVSPFVVGRRVAGLDIRCARLRRPLGPALARALVGRRIERSWRRGKYLVFDLDDGQAWILHFGMSGRLLHLPGPDGWSPGKHDHVVVRMSDGSLLVFHDPRKFGLMAVEAAASSRLLAGLGPEPTDRAAFNATYLATLSRRTRRAVKDVLMDQRVVAGLGNIYANEILFAAGIRPRRRMPRLSRRDYDRLPEATREILDEAIRHRGSTISDFLDGIGRRGSYQWHRRVYNREGEPCPRCAAAIRKVVIAGRASFYCPQCQR